MLTTSFELSNTNVLKKIEAILVSDRSIRAEFYKLNIYCGPNGHFKPHLDTPRSDSMLGSLVVCLSTSFAVFSANKDCKQTAASNFSNISTD